MSSAEVKVLISDENYQIIKDKDKYTFLSVKLHNSVYGDITISSSIENIRYNNSVLILYTDTICSASYDYTDLPRDEFIKKYFEEPCYISEVKIRQEKIDIKFKALISIKYASTNEVMDHYNDLTHWPTTWNSEASVVIEFNKNNNMDIVNTLAKLDDYLSYSDKKFDTLNDIKITHECKDWYSNNADKCGMTLNQYIQVAINDYYNKNK